MVIAVAVAVAVVVCYLLVYGAAICCLLLYAVAVIVLIFTTFYSLIYQKKYAAIMEDMPFVLLGLFDDDKPLASTIAYDIVNTQTQEPVQWDSSLTLLASNTEK